MFNSDLLDEYCRNIYGHTNWEYQPTKCGGIKVFFHEEDTEEQEEGVIND